MKKLIVLVSVVALSVSGFGMSKCPFKKGCSKNAVVRECCAKGGKGCCTKDGRKCCAKDGKGCCAKKCAEKAASDLEKGAK